MSNLPHRDKNGGHAHSFRPSGGGEKTESRAGGGVGGAAAATRAGLCAGTAKAPGLAPPRNECSRPLATGRLTWPKPWTGSRRQRREEWTQVVVLADFFIRHDADARGVAVVGEVALASSRTRPEAGRRPASSGKKAPYRAASSRCLSLVPFDR